VGQNGNYDVVITNSFSSVTSSVATLTFYTPRTLRWSGIGSDWDTTSQNWTANNGGSTTAYIETDIVRFDSLGIAQSSVNLTGSRTPSAIVVSNASYTLSGGSIDGSGSLSIVNNGALVLSTADNGSGSVNIAGGSSLEVNVGGVLGSGALTNNGALIFNLSSDQAYGYPIYGTGSITNRGSTGRITLGGNVAATYLVQEGPNELLLQGQNSLGGGLHVLSGLAIARSEGAFGGGATILSGGELNIPFSFNFTGGSLTLAGGSLTSDGTTSFDGPVSLAVDSTVTARGADLVLSNAAGISGAGFMLTKTGNGVLTLAGTTNRWSELIVSAGTLRIGAGGMTGGLGSGSAQLSGALDFNLSGDITVTNAIGGGGFITHNGSGTTTLTGDESAFVGAINVTNGTLRLNVASAASAATVAGGALGGSGSIGGNVDVLAGGALAPGNGVGTFTVQGSLNLGGNLQIDVNRSLAQSNDLIVVSGSLNSTSTGTVVVNNLGPALAVGNSFKLFSQPLLGGETLTVSGAGAVWTNRLATDGTIQVLSTSVPQPRIVTTTVVANQIIFSGTNGAANGSYQVLSSTNIATPLANWASVASGSFNGTGQFSITNAISPNEPQRFYLLKVQ
jgi:fibronectin-binding autotransporter adhesin